MNILGITLARGGSKGIPNKNKKMLCGKPVICWTIEEAKKSKYLTDYVVSSDDSDILELAAVAEVTHIRRPTNLALDGTPTLPALIYSALAIETRTGKEFDYIIEIRATSPLKTIQDIDAAIEMLLEAPPEVDSVIGVTECQEYHPARVKYLENGKIRDFLPEPVDGRRQNLTPPAYIRNGTIYALKRRVIMGQQPKLFGHEHSLAYIMPPERSVNLDSPIDFKLAEVLLQERLDNEKHLLGR